jgi:hypothetical protein
VDGAAVKESTITAAIMRWLHAQPDVYAFKVHGHAMMRVGIPDIVASVGGLAVYLEVKTEKGIVTKRQLAEHDLIDASGAICAVVRSLADAQEFVGAARNVRVLSGVLHDVKVAAARAAREAAAVRETQA